MSDENPFFSLAMVAMDKMSRFDPLRHCDPARLTRYMDSFRAGRLRDLALVMDAIEERDDVLASVAPKAKSAVARHGWEILTVNTEDNATAAQAQGQKAALEAFYNNLRVTNALDQDELGGVSLLLRQMMTPRASATPSTTSSGSRKTAAGTPPPFGSPRSGSSRTRPDGCASSRTPMATTAFRWLRVNGW